MCPCTVQQNAVAFPVSVDHIRGVGSSPAAKAKRRSAWFDLGVRALTNLGINTGGRYACPLCLDLFERGAIEAVELTDEDVPPKALGGRPTILTCKSCNNGGGTTLDAHAQREDALFRLMAGVPSRRSVLIHLAAGDHAVPLKAHIDGKGVMQMVGNPNAAHPDANSAVWQALDAAAEGGEVDIRMLATNVFEPVAANISFLRSAYLASFAIYGYRFILRPSMERVRLQIQYPEQDHCPSLIGFVGSGTRTNTSFMIVDEPSWARSITFEFGMRRVMFPRYGEDNLEAFRERIQQGLTEAGGGEAVLHGPGGSLPTKPQHVLDFADTDHA